MDQPPPVADRASDYGPASVPVVVVLSDGQDVQACASALGWVMPAAAIEAMATRQAEPVGWCWSRTSS